MQTQTSQQQLTMSREATPVAMRRRPVKVQQACDACHTRKVRCNGNKPCSNCLNPVDCTYLAVHKKTGPKGPRHVRRQQFRQSPIPATKSRPSPGSEGRGRYPPSPATGTPLAAANCQSSPAAAWPPEGDDFNFRPSPRVSCRVVQWCLDAYFTHKYPLTPILDRDQAWLWSVPTSPEKYSLVTACCAVVALSPEILPPPQSHELIVPSADFLISECIRARKHSDLAGSPSLTHTQTSFFLYAAFFCKDKDNAAWFYLREAITILQTLRLEEEATYPTLDPVLAKYARRMFWVLYVTERAYSLQRNRPTTLQETLDLPDFGPLGSDTEILPGFLGLISLFRHLDSDLIAAWNSATRSTSADLITLQNRLDQTLPGVAGYSPVQQADLLMSRQWLKMIVWKLCVSQSTLSATEGSENAMSLLYPAAIARDVVVASRLVSTEAFEANGIGILEKVFDVGCSLADVLLLVPDSGRGSAMHVGPLDTLMEIVRLVGTRFGGNYRHFGMLADKAHGCLIADVDRSLPMSLSDADTPEEVEDLGL
ncbi:RING-3 [Plectosphaerella plurivora]|uniref:RING-3 n=1 Tax=Plectosphaerella plurivora TaxID=936078 RepID=A0A9P9ADG4_9PEZI|nr:RING-3 [Plectosphaerella plurivora]